MIYDASNEDNIIEAIKEVEAYNKGQFLFEITKQPQRDSYIYYVWDLFTMFGIKFGYTASEFQAIASQKLEDFMDIFKIEVEKSNGTKVELIGTVDALTDDKLKELSSRLITYAKEKFNGYKLPEYTEWLSTPDVRNTAERYDLILKTFR